MRAALEYPRQESNLRLLAPEASALSTELRGRVCEREKDIELEHQVSSLSAFALFAELCVFARNNIG